MSESEGFLSRWSRRKRAATAGAPIAEPASAPAPLPAEAPPPAPPPTVAVPAEPEFDPASLPPVESLTTESDITAFLRPEVPAVLRNAALRRVWSLDPAIRDYVGPADYAWDYNAPDGVPGFSLELGGDVKRLLAQAIGLNEPDEEEARDPASGPEVAEVPMVSAPEPVPVLLEEAAPQPLRLVELSPPEAEPERPALAEVEAEPEAEEEAPRPPPRRHGGAVPV